MSRLIMLCITPAGMRAGQILLRPEVLLLQALGAEEISKSNPVVVAQKVAKI